MVTVSPSALGDLFDVFTALDSGTSVALNPTENDPSHAVSDATPPPTADVWLGVWSSGTTGRPKRVWKRWETLVNDGAKRKRDAALTWASPFQPWTFAGVHVALHAWKHSETIVTLGHGWDTDWRLIRDRKVTALSCTPTYLNLLVAHAGETRTSAKAEGPRGPGRALALGRIVLGGEPIRAVHVKRFRDYFPDPKTKFTLVYASAEFGVLMTSKRIDGWAELTSLEARYPDWRVAGGLLEVFRDDAWCGTGDRVEVDDNLIRVLGRGDQVANVGGTKVALETVSSRAAEIPGVAHAVATSEPNSVTGEIVALRVVFEGGGDLKERLRMVEEELRKTLPKPAWPRRYEIGEWILGDNAKGTMR